MRKSGTMPTDAGELFKKTKKEVLMPQRIPHGAKQGNKKQAIRNPASEKAKEQQEKNCPVETAHPPLLTTITHAQSLLHSALIPQTHPCYCSRNPVRLARLTTSPLFFLQLPCPLSPRYYQHHPNPINPCLPPRCATRLIRVFRLPDSYLTFVSLSLLAQPP